MWLTLRTDSKGKFLRSSLKDSISLWAKINFCSSTAWRIFNSKDHYHIASTQRKHSPFYQLESWNYNIYILFLVKQNKWEVYLPPIFTLPNCIQTFVHIIRNFPVKKKSSLVRNTNSRYSSFLVYGYKCDPKEIPLHFHNASQPYKFEIAKKRSLFYHCKNKLSYPKNLSFYHSQYLFIIFPSKMQQFYTAKIVRRGYFI